MKIKYQEARDSLRLLGEIASGFVYLKSFEIEEEDYEVLLDTTVLPIYYAISLMDGYLTKTTGKRDLEKDVKKILELFTKREVLFTLSDQSSQLKYIWPNQDKQKFLDLLLEENYNGTRKWKTITAKGENYVALQQTSYLFLKEDGT